MTFSAGDRVTAASLNAVQLLQTTTLGGSQPSIVLNVPVGVAFNFLLVKWRIRCTDANAAEQLYAQLNGDTGSNYLWELNQANNAGAVSGGTSGAATTHIQVGTVPAANATALYFGSGSFEIAGASDAVNYKTVTGTGSAFATTTNMWSGTYSGQWNSASAVTSVTIAGGIGNLAAGCVASLYGSS